MDSTRIDRWLWAVRLTKTRPDAAAACRGGHVRINDRPAKPSTTVAPATRCARWSVSARVSSKWSGDPEAGGGGRCRDLLPRPDPAGAESLDRAGGGARPGRRSADETGPPQARKVARRAMTPAHHSKATPGPRSSSRTAATLPVIASASPRPATSGPLPADQSRSVATNRTPRVCRRPPPARCRNASAGPARCDRVQRAAARRRR